MPRKPPTPTDTTPDSNDGTGGTGGTDTTGTSGGTTGGTAGTSGGTTCGTAGTSTGGATTTRTPVIQHIIKLCGFSEDSTMVKYIDQEEWTDLAHVTTLLIDDIKDFHTLRSDGNYEASPLKTHCRMFKCFLLYYKWRCDDMSTILDEDDVLGLFTRTLFLEYCGSADCYCDIQVFEG